MKFKQEKQEHRSVEDLMWPGLYMYMHKTNMTWWLVCYGLVKFSIYFNNVVTGKKSSFQTYTCCQAPTPGAARGFIHAEPILTWAQESRHPERSLTSLPSEGPHVVRICQKLNSWPPDSLSSQYLLTNTSCVLTFEDTQVTFLCATSLSFDINIGCNLWHMK